MKDAEVENVFCPDALNKKPEQVGAELCQAKCTWPVFSPYQAIWNNFNFSFGEFFPSASIRAYYTYSFQKKNDMVGLSMQTKEY